MAGLLFADEFLLKQSRQEAVTKEFRQRFDALNGQEVKAVLGVDQTGGGEDVEVRVKNEVVAEGLRGSDGGELAVGQVEASAHPVAQGADGDVEEVGEKLAALAEDAAQGSWHGEHELAVGDVETDRVGDPVADAADAPLMAGGAEVAGLAGEGEELFVTAVRALQTCEAGSEIAATVELIDDVDAVGRERSVDPAMTGFVTGEEVVPGVVDDLPERRGTRASGAVNGWRHQVNCSYEQY